VNSVADRVVELAGPDIGTIVSSVSWQLGDHLEHLTLGGSANLSAIGNALTNILTGNSGNNLLNGMAGADTLIGGDGSDSYYVDDPGDRIIETRAGPAGGSDTVYSSLADYTLPDHVEHLRLRASGPANGTGNGLDNTLRAGAGDNVLDGAGGNDTVSYSGAAGGVIASLATGSASGGSGNDTLWSIANLTGSDHADQLSGDDGDRLLYDTLTGVLAYDPDGTGVRPAVAFGTLTGTPDLAAIDIWVA